MEASGCDRLDHQVGSCCPEAAAAFQTRHTHPPSAADVQGVVGQWAVLCASCGDGEGLNESSDVAGGD